MGKRWFFIIFFCLLLLALGVFGTITLFLFHSPSEPADGPSPDPSTITPGSSYHEQMTLAEESAVYHTGYIHKYDSGYHRVYGIDISSWNNVNGGDIDWEQVHNAGIEYVFIRAALRGYGEEGNLVTDKYFHQNIQDAQANGLLVGCYIYSQAITQEEAREEAQYILDLIRNYTVQMPVVMDCEFAEEAEGGGRLSQAGLSPELYALVCGAFCKEIRDAGYTPMVYGNVPMLGESIRHDILGPTHLWVAQYNDICSLTSLDYTFWQFTNLASVPGINGEVDVNVWYLPETVSLRPQDAVQWLQKTDGVSGVG